MLVIDDDLAILDVVKIILEEKKYKVTTTSDIHFVYSLSDDTIPDIILLDIWMADSDGRNIAQYLKSQKALAYIPIIFVSAHNDTEKIAKQAGVADFLLKPFDIDTLINMIEKHT